jgi:hypothetical protein
MSTIVTRAGKGSPLTHAEVDSNFTNLNSDKVEASAGTLTNPTIAGVASFADGSASAPAITNTGDTNTGIFFPAADTIAFAEGGAEAMRLDSSGNLGIGVTPSAWASGYKALQVAKTAVLWGGASSNDIYFGNNYYFDGSDLKYISTGFASEYFQDSGKHVWRTAPSGTAGGTVTMTQAMTLDASGNLGIGTTSPSGKLGVSDGTCQLVVQPFNAAAVGYMGTSTNHNLAFLTNSTERGRFDTSGNLLVGGTSVSNPAGWTKGVQVNANFPFLSIKNSTGQYDLAGFGGDFWVWDATAAAARMVIDSGGNLLVGTTSNPSASVAGSRIGPSGFMEISRGSGTNSWSQLSFINGNGTVGTVSTSGSSTSYNTSSDYRLKHDIAPMTGALAKVSALKPCTYKWNTDNSNGEGFIAHELAEVIPQAVTGEKDAVETYVDEDGVEQTRPKYQGIDTSFLVATLTAAIQEQQAIITDLKARIESLENK